MCKNLLKSLMGGMPEGLMAKPAKAPDAPLESDPVVKQVTEKEAGQSVLPGAAEGGSTPAVSVKGSAGGSAASKKRKVTRGGLGL